MNGKYNDGQVQTTLVPYNTNLVKENIKMETEQCIHVVS